MELDEEFRQRNMVLLERFYKLMDSVYRFYKDLNTFFDDLFKGNYVQNTFEGVLLDVEGKQLVTEAVYLYGVILLLLDMRIPGFARERIIVCYYRYKGAGTIPNVDDVVKLCRQTGYVHGVRRPEGYPETFFERFTFPVSG